MCSSDLHPPDYVGLICLRADRRGEALTLVGPIRHSVPLLSADQVATLRQATYRVRPPSSFVTTGPAIEQPRLLPIISGPICNPRLRVDFHNMAGSDDNATAAMANLKDVLTSTAVGIALTPGDMLIIDNAAAAHGRTAFRPYYDGHDRWLQRAYAARDLQMSSSSRRPGSHVLTASLGSDNRG